MMRGLFAELSSNLDIDFNSRYTKVYHISLNSQKKELSQCMSYEKSRLKITERGGQEMFIF